MNKEQLAKWLHDNYEEVAKEKDWNTQENCKVEFDTLPDANKQTMIEIAQRLLDFKLLRLHFVSQQSELLLAFFDLADELPMGLSHYDREKIVEEFLANNCG